VAMELCRLEMANPHPLAHGPLVAQKEHENGPSAYEVRWGAAWEYVTAVNTVPTCQRGPTDSKNSLDARCCSLGAKSVTAVQPAANSQPWHARPTHAQPKQRAILAP
jgi:hypothetical protein